ncbi:MAG: hypothetical protein HY559_01290 [Gammaproteobacteria bacterium]|nr:hypothetical protein [Gammaproteobacteria bacterium]
MINKLYSFMSFAVVLLLLSISLLAEPIPYDPDKDFSKGQFDLQQFLVESEKQVTDPEIYLACCKNFDQFTTSLANEFTEENLKTYSMQDLLNHVVRQMDQKGRILRGGSKSFMLSSFSGQKNRKKPIYDCDISCATAQVVLFKLQKKFPHYQILDNFRLIEIPGHMACAIIDGNQKYYADLNGDWNDLKEGEESKLAFQSPPDYLKGCDLSSSYHPELDSEEEIKSWHFSLLALHYYLLGNNRACQTYLDKSFSGKNDMVQTLALQAELFYEEGKYLEAIAVYEKIESILVGETNYPHWVDALCKTKQPKKVLKLIEGLPVEVLHSPTASIPWCKAQAFHTLSRKYYKKKQFKNGLSFAQKALESYEEAYQQYNDPYYLEIKTLKESIKAKAEAKARLEGEENTEQEAEKALHQFERLYRLYQKGVANIESDLNDSIENYLSQYVDLNEMNAGKETVIIEHEQFLKEISARIEKSKTSKKAKQKLASALKACNLYTKFFKKIKFPQDEIVFLLKPLYQYLAKNAGLQSAEDLSDFSTGLLEKRDDKRQELFEVLKAAAEN